MVSTKEEIKEEIRCAIMNANRNLYEWVYRVKRRKDVGSLTYEEVHGVVKNWIVRRLRKVIGFTEITALTQRGNITVALNDQGYIVSVKLFYDDHWSLATKIANMIQDILYFLDYESLRYTPLDVKPTFNEIEPDNSVIVDLSSIEKITF